MDANIVVTGFVVLQLLINSTFIYQYLFCFSTCLLPLIIRKRVFRLLCSWTFQVEQHQQAGESI